LVFYGGEKFVSKNISKKPRGKNGKSQMNQVKLWDTIGRNNSN